MDVDTRAPTDRTQSGQRNRQDARVDLTIHFAQTRDSLAFLLPRFIAARMQRLRINSGCAAVSWLRNPLRERQHGPTTPQFCTNE